MTHTHILSATTVLTFLAVLGVSRPVEAHQHTQTHAKLTRAGYRLLDSARLRADARASGVDIEAELALGVMNEDECIVADDLDLEWHGHANYQSHFYEPVTQGNRLPVFPIPSCSNDGFIQMGARARAGMLWEQAVQHYRDGQSDALSAERSRLYKRRAYRVLGRVLHLLQDMTSPAHVHNDPHANILGHTQGLCEGDGDDFENWGYCGDADFPDDPVSNRIAGYVNDSDERLDCDNDDQTDTPPAFTCLLWNNLTKLYGAAPQGLRSLDLDPTESAAWNTAEAFVHGVARITYDFTTFRVRLLDIESGVTDPQPLSEFRRMFRGNGYDRCGLGVEDYGLCEISGGFTISGEDQEVGFSDGRCGESRIDAGLESNEQWWIMEGDCVGIPASSSASPTETTGYAYIENSGGGGVLEIGDDYVIPAYYGCAPGDERLCGQAGARSKELFRRLYDTNENVDKTLLKIYGDVLYSVAVVYSAGLIEAFAAEVVPPLPPDNGEGGEGGATATGGAAGESGSTGGAPGEAGTSGGGDPSPANQSESGCGCRISEAKGYERLAWLGAASLLIAFRRRMRRRV